MTAIPFRRQGCRASVSADSRARQRAIREGSAMKFPRRQFLRLAAGAAAAPAIASPIVRAQPAPAPKFPIPPLAQRLAAYADKLRFEDIDAATIERVKSHLIDAIGCGIAAFDETPVRICRDVALTPGSGGSSVIGTSKRTTADLAAFANGAAFRYYDLERRLCRPVCRPSQRPYRGVHRRRGSRARQCRGPHHLDCAGIRDQLPADGCARHRGAQLGSAGA